MKFLSLKNTIIFLLFLGVLMLIMIHSRLSLNGQQQLNHIVVKLKEQNLVLNHQITEVHLSSDKQQLLAIDTHASTQALAKNFQYLNRVVTSRHLSVPSVPALLKKLQQEIKEKITKVHSLATIQGDILHLKTKISNPLQTMVSHFDDLRLSSQQTRLLLDYITASSAYLMKTNTRYYTAVMIVADKLKAQLKPAQLKQLHFEHIMQMLEQMQHYQKNVSQTLQAISQLKVGQHLQVLSSAFERYYVFQSKRALFYQWILYALSVVFLLLALIFILQLQKTTKHLQQEVIQRQHVQRRLTHYQTELKQTLQEQKQALNHEAQEKKMALEREVYLERELAHSQKLNSIGVLAGGIAHDFNNLLAGILGYADLLRDTNIDDTYKGWASNIVKASNRAADLTNQLLGFARKKKQAKQAVNMNDMVKEASQLLSRTVSKEININQVLEPTLLPVEGDASQISQVLVNLGINARDAIQGVGTITYQTEHIDIDETLASHFGNLIPAGRYIKVSISDTGSGIPKALQQKIFDPFFTTKEVGKGTGLGLAMVYGIVQQHQGLVRVYSEEGHGTVFNILLPVKEAQTTPTKSDIISQAIVEPIGDIGILVVDDEAMCRDLVYQVLKKYTRAKVYFAQDGRQGVEIFEKHQHDIKLIILDLIMPNLDGLHAFSQIRALNSNVMVLFSSGYSQKPEIQEAIQSDRVGFLLKPFTAEILLKKMCELIHAKPDHRSKVPFSS